MLPLRALLVAGVLRVFSVPATSTAAASHPRVTISCGSPGLHAMSNADAGGHELNNGTVQQRHGGVDDVTCTNLLRAKNF